MYEHGYVIFHKEINMIAIEVRGSACVEYAFLKLDPEFVNPASRTERVDVLAKSFKKKPKSLKMKAIYNYIHPIQKRMIF